MDTPQQLTGKNILLGVTGGIACFKAASLASRLVQAGADLTVLMTEAATRFVGPLTFESLSGKPVLTSTWEQSQHHDSQHVALARDADLLVIAPASANTIAKLAAGFCDSPLTTIALALPRTTPVLLAPAMNAGMWENPLTQANLEKLRKTLGWRIVGPGTGWLACRTEGAGRMSEPDMIFQHALKAISGRTKSEVRRKK